MQIPSNFGGNPLSTITRDINNHQLAITADQTVSVEVRDEFADSVSVSVDGTKFDSPLLSTRKPQLEGEAHFPKSAPPKLDRPVVFLHGFMGVPEEFSDMQSWLSSSGENIAGGTVRADDLKSIDPKANMFSLEFGKPYQPVSKNAQEIKATVDAICKATGFDSVDLVAHSKGGLDARTYMMDQSEKVDHVVTIGTPHLGTPLADIELFVREKLDRPIKPPIKDPQVNQALRELSVYDPKNPGKNEMLHQLNDNWNIQSSRADFMAIAGSGRLTINQPIGLTMKGDGVVTTKSASALEGAEPGSVNRHRHGSLPRNEKVMLQVASFLSGDKKYDLELDEITKKEQSQELSHTDNAIENSSVSKQEQPVNVQDGFNIA